MTTAERENPLKELEFELSQGNGSRFLLAVCDDIERSNRIRTELNAHIRENDRDVVSIYAPTKSGNLVDAILKASEAGKPGAVHILEAKNVPETTDKLFSELNFQRDSLARLEIPMVVWLRTDQVERLASRAPDFWSRRTAIVYFDRLSTDALLDRIFGRRTQTVDIARDEISKALRDILSAERELDTCLSHKSNFSLPKTDKIIQKLRSSIQQLSRECSRGRKIDVVLWLWNASLMNRKFGHDWSRGLTDVSADLDQNELLLSLAAQADKLLNRYLQQVEQRIRSKASISLLGLFITYATNIWRDMVRRATRDAMRTLSIEPYDLVEFRSISPTYTEDVFRDRALQQFERWLAAEDVKKPMVFTDEEAAVLKYLYRSKSGEKSPRPVPARRLSELIPHLERKVRLWLGSAG